MFAGGQLIEGRRAQAHPPVVFDLRTASEDAVEPSQAHVAALGHRSAMPTRQSPRAAVKIEQTYTMSDRHRHNLDGAARDFLACLGTGTTCWTLYDSTQMVVGTKKLVSLVLGIPEEKINVVCEFLGGGFGGKSWSWPHELAGLALAC